MRRTLRWAALLFAVLAGEAHAFPETPILDTFPGGNQTPIAGNWAGPLISGTNQFNLVSNALTCDVTGTVSCSSYWNATNFSGRVQVYIQATTWWSNANSDFGLWCNGNAEGTAGRDGYLLYVFTSGGVNTWRIGRTDNNTGTTLGADLGNQNIANGDWLGFECNAGTLSAWYKAAAGSWTQVGTSRSDSTYLSGHIGVMKGFDDSTTILNNFGGGSARGGFPLLGVGP